MEKNALIIDNLSVVFQRSGGSPATVVSQLSLSIPKGKITALVGESGSGKSVTALSILKLLPYPQASHPSGRILFEGKNLLSLSEHELRSIRGRKIAMIFQEPQTALNPLHTIGKQLAEAIRLHQNWPESKIEWRIHELMGLVGLDGLKHRLGAYPHELSGGQRQRVMIAMALSNNPDILIADEPTTALDVTIQAQILALLKKLQKELGMSVLMITHDLNLVKKMADHVAVMKSGKIVEKGTTTQVFGKPRHAYTKTLIHSTPSGKPPALSGNAKPLTVVENLSVRFPVKKGFFGRPSSYVNAVQNAGFRLRAGETIGLVGESGSGKTSLAMAVLRLIKSEGSIRFEGQELQQLRYRDTRALRRQMQLVFQDPFASLNPRLTIAETIAEGLKAHNIGTPAEQMTAIDAVLRDVGLEPSVKYRYPHEFSGGQRQRIAIARALVLKPKLMVLDEPTSALDISTQGEILALLKKLQKNYKLSYLFISHDLRVINAMSHHILVMKDGKIVETGSTASVIKKPKSPYTRALLDAALNLKAH